jgi:hypothetical protein
MYTDVSLRSTKYQDAKCAPWQDPSREVPRPTGDPSTEGEFFNRIAREKTHPLLVFFIWDGTPPPPPGSFNAVVVNVQNMPSVVEKYALLLGKASLFKFRRGSVVNRTDDFRPASIRRFTTEMKIRNRKYIL